MSLLSDPTQLAPVPGRGRVVARIVAVLLVVSMLGLALGRLPSGPPAAGTTQASLDKHAVTILGGEPVTLDPAVQGDLGSAQVTAQLFETLTASIRAS